MPRGTTVKQKVTTNLTLSEDAVDAQGFWERLQELHPGKNAPEIAKETGRTKQTVYRWRDGEIPGLDVLMPLSQSHGVSLHWLVTGRGPKFVEHAEQPPSDTGSQNKTHFQKHFDASVFEMLRRLGESTGRTVEQVIADGERRVAEFTARTMEGSKSLSSDDSGSKQPHLQADRPDQEPKSDERQAAWKLLLLEQNEKILALLEMLVEKQN